jgi:hypothetical protein
MANLLKFKMYEEVPEGNGRGHWSIQSGIPFLCHDPG